MTATSHLELVLVEQAQAQKEVTVNTALNRIDAILNTGVIDKDLATPPGSPAEGDVYIVATSATDDWEDKDGAIAYYNQVWRFITPREGMTLWVNDEDVWYVYDGTAWTKNIGIALDSLSDVTITTPSDGHVLKYDSVSGAWKNDTVSGGGGGGAPTNATYIVQTPDATLTNEQALSSLASGVLKNTTGTGVLSVSQVATSEIADDAVTYAKIQNVSATDKLLGRSTAGAGDVEEITCTAAGRALIDDADATAQRTTLGLGALAVKSTASLTADVTGILPGANGGTGNGFMQFSGPASSTKTYTLPNQNDTLVATGTSSVFTTQQNFGTQNLTDGASIGWNLSTQQVASVTLGGNRTLSNPTNMVNGGTYVLIVKQDGTGSRTLAYGTAYKWPVGTAPVLTTSANGVDILTFVSDGTNMYGVIQKGFA